MEIIKQANSSNDLVTVKVLSLETRKGKEFVDKLEELCRTYAIGDNFFFKFDVSEHIDARHL